MLQAEGLAAFRGERLVFRDLTSPCPSAAPWCLPARTDRASPRCCGCWRGWCGRRPGGCCGAARTRSPTCRARPRLVYVGHHDAVKLGLTAAENLRCRRLGGRPVPDALAAMGLSALADLPARMLSAGQKRRLALARLALSAAPLWLLDEPTLGLDVASVERFGVLLAGHRARGGLVVAATHLPLPLEGRWSCGWHDARFRGRPGAANRAFAAPWRRYAGRPAVLPAGGLAVPARNRPGAGDARPHRARHHLGLRAAGRPAAARPAVRCRFRGRLARPLAALRAAGGRDRRRQGPAHWLVTGLPLLLAAAPLAIMLRMPEEGIPALLAGLLPGHCCCRCLAPRARRLCSARAGAA